MRADRVSGARRGIFAVIQAKTVEQIRERLTEVFVLTDGYLQVPKKKELPSFEMMDKFNPQKLEENVDVFNQALHKYLAEYEKAGICPRHFENVTKFVEDYNKYSEDRKEKPLKITTEEGTLS